MSLRWVAFIAVVIAVVWVRVGAGTARPHARRRVRARTGKTSRLARFSFLREGARRRTRGRGAGFTPAPGVRPGECATLGTGLFVRYRRSHAESGFGVRARGKREARAAPADAAAQCARAAGRTAPPDLLAEVARRYLDLVPAQSMADLVAAEVAQRQRWSSALAKRVRAGATPDSVRLSAEAARRAPCCSEIACSAQGPARWP